ncbi:MAG: coproporphyrinogen III oxidase [Rhodospirillaceae bacterium]|nr:coproporphyrinogen III oxidase [Rhodospirillaceae bacterium]
MDCLAIYIHWPFCESKCPYCDFNSHVRRNINVSEWKDALLMEIDYYASRTSGKNISSIFFGGGTPSLMPPELVGELISRIDLRWGIEIDCEVTLEANPTGLETKNFNKLAQAGINRISVGVQALNSSDLNFLGRKHTPKEALTAVETAQKAVKRVSFDLIYGRPQQTTNAWTTELERALSIGTEHVSLYQLTIERGTSFFASFRDGDFCLPDEEKSIQLFQITDEICSKEGLKAYEISNHAREGAESRHNLNCWQGADYVGIGPGAHGRITIDKTCYETEQISSPENWLNSVKKNGHGTRRYKPIPHHDRTEEIIMTGLRLTKGLERSRFEAQTRCELEQIFNPRTLKILLDNSLLELDEMGMRATKEGQLKLNTVIASLLT